jgi:hypothetical protein
MKNSVQVLYSLYFFLSILLIFKKRTNGYGYNNVIDLGLLEVLERD